MLNPSQPSRARAKARGAEPAGAKYASATTYDQLNIKIPAEFPSGGLSARAAEEIVNSETWTDANPELNLSSFVTTYCEPELRDIYLRHAHKNFADPDMYPHTKLTESKVVNWLHDLWNGPKVEAGGSASEQKQREPYGAATIGSSEACMLAGLAHKWNWRKKREQAGKDASRPNMVTGGNVQIVWKKYMRYFDVEPHVVPLKRGSYGLTAERLEQYVDENTTCVVAIAGQTFTGEDDDLAGIQSWLDDYERRTGHSVPMHVDAASGGFVNPFLYPDYAWDFRLPRVQSINTSGHKFGLVYPGLGWIVFRERAVFPEELVFYVNYLGGEAPTATLNFSKGAATVLMQYYQILRFGREGYTRIMQHALDNSLLLRDRLMETGKFEILNQTQRIPVVALSLKPGITRYNEFDISNKVREKGWVVSAYTMPPDAQDVRTLRIVVRPHLNNDCVNILANDIESAIEYLEQHGGTATPPPLHEAANHSVKC